MRRLILFLGLAAAAFPSAAAKRLSVLQLEQSLSADFASHRPDADIAHRVGEVELSERLSDETLDRFAARLPLGPRAALALQLLADQSAFLDPPPSELPATAPPDPSTQQHILDLARGFAVGTWPKLPNFYVTRTTHRFDDSPQVLKQGDWPVRAGLHLVGSSSRQVTFRDGKEVLEASLPAAAAASAPSAGQPEAGLHTWGEFGPELLVVLADAAKGKLTFSHWEQTPAGLAAVFRYSVPRAASHYAVNYCCIRQDEFIERRELTYRARNQTSQQMANLPKTSLSEPFKDTPGYHGSLFINAASGAVLRITLEAELKDSDPITRAATVVQYGPVKIGDQRYICPLHSLAVSTEPPTYNANGEPRSPSVLLINETSFTEYHRLGSTMRVLADASGAGNQAPDASQPDAPIAAGSGSTALSAPPQNPSSLSPSGQPAPERLVPNSPPSPAPLDSAPAGNLAIAVPPSASPVPEVTLGEADRLPDGPTIAPEPPDTTVTLKVTSRLVDVGVIVHDKKGHAVQDLAQNDFEVYDNGRKQEIRFFSQYSAEPPPVPAGQQPPSTFSNRSPDPAGPVPGGSTSDSTTTILLIDENHIAWADLNNARQQVLKFLSGVAPGEKIGLYAMSESGFKVLREITANHDAIAARLKTWMPSVQSVAEAQREEERNRQQFNEVRNVSDLNAVNGNHIDTPDSQETIDPQLRTMGDNPGRAALIILGGVARHLSALSGHKNLIWFSSDNVFADWRDQAVGVDKSSKYIDAYALRAQESLNDAHVAVYPFDVSQLEAGTISADIQHRNVELTQAAQDSAALASAGAAASGRSTSSSPGGTRDMSPGRLSAEMSQDLHPFQGPIRQLAESTGGRTIRRAGDMASQMAGVVAEGHAAYRLSFHPDTNADNQYHTITVKLNGKHGLIPRYRTGYFYAREPSTLHERFQQAVWRPMDANEVAVTASVGRMSDGANVKINIAAGDLGMQQQAGRWMDKLDIFFIQRDDAGVHAQVEGQTMGLRLKPETYQNLLPAGVPFEQVVRLKPGTASLRVLVVDENSGRMGSVTIPAEALSEDE